jgi:hypothetical protein
MQADKKTIHGRGWRHLSLFLGISIALALQACPPLGADDYEEVPGQVGQVSLPDTVAVGAEFRVDILTHGNNGCWLQGGVRVSEITDGYELAPYDMAYRGSEACTMAIVNFEHHVPLVFSETGLKTIRVVKGQWGADITSVENHQVLVLPAWPE